MTVDVTAAWLAVAELLDNAGLAGDFDAERERTYRMVLQPWEAQAVTDTATGEQMPVLVAAVLRVLRSRPDLRFLPAAGVIAEQCRAIAGEATAAIAAPAGEAVTLAERAAYQPGSEADRIAWLRARGGDVAADWLASIGTARIRSSQLAGDHAGYARRDLEQSYIDYAQTSQRRAELGHPTTTAAILEQRGTASISELTGSAEA